MELQYEIKLPTLNEYIDIERTNKFKAHALKTKFTMKIRLMTLSQTRTKINGLNDLSIQWIRTNKRHDADNVFFGVKFLLDGIVAAHVLPGDDRKYIRNISHTIEQGNREKIIIKFNSVM